MANDRNTENAALIAFFTGAVIAAGATLLLTPDLCFCMMPACDIN